jgi:hypothetical protein
MYTCSRNARSLMDRQGFLQPIRQHLRDATVWDPAFARKTCVSGAPVSLHTVTVLKKPAVPF